VIKRILVPSGIGDFSWTWSKLVTTGDQYEVDYVGGAPDRMKAYLALLPKDKIIAFRSNPNYTTGWDKNEQLICIPRNQQPLIPTAQRYADLSSNQLSYVECNTLLESGVRLEKWLEDEIPNIDFHYKIDGTLPKCVRNNYFIVNFSSYGTKKAWGYYEVPDTRDLVIYINKKTGWMPIFIGGHYDDYTADIHRRVIARGIPAIDLVGKTPELLEVISLLQQSQFYFGACSGLMALANVLYIPTIVYYPPFKTPPGRRLSGTWHDPNVLHVGLFWDGRLRDEETLDPILTNLMKENVHKVYNYA